VRSSTQTAFNCLVRRRPESTAAHSNRIDRVHRVDSTVVLLCLSLVFSCPHLLTAQDTPGDAASTSEDAIHDELRALREAMTQAVLEGNTEQQLAHVDDDVVITWQNNQVVRKVAGLREFFQEMNTGEDRVFQGYKVPPTADELSILHGGDTAIAFGSSTPHYKYLGMEFDLKNRWTATLVKDADQWKIAAYHVSGDISDNPILSIAKRSIYLVGGVCLIVGFVLGMLLAKLSRKRTA